MRFGYCFSQPNRETPQMVTAKSNPGVTAKSNPGDAGNQHIQEITLMIRLPEKVKNLISTLQEAGFEAFAVGGCVRDSLLGRKPNDWDLCTSATPDEMKSVFCDFRVIETGLQHGTLTVLMDGEAFEITTYRIDGEYSDGRRPDEVTFTSKIEDDLARRDFTINAMAYNDTAGLVDPFGGQSDLACGLLRCVGEPAQRFTEDSLRILRCVRFASQLDYIIENSTTDAMYECLPLLKRVAVERIRTEFDKLLCGPAASGVLREHRGIIADFIPEIRPMFDLDQKNDYHIYDVWEHTLHVLQHIPADPKLRLAAFFHDIGKPPTMTVTDEDWGHFYGHEAAGAGITNSVMRRLKYDNETREDVISVIDAHKIVFQQTQRHARRCLAKLGEPRLRMLIELELADVKSQNPAFTGGRAENILAFSDLVDEVLAGQQCFSMKDLAVSGRDLMDADIPQGPEIGRILKILLEQVIEGKLPNERQALMESIKILRQS